MTKRRSCTETRAFARWGWPVLMLFAYVGCSEVLARMHRSLLDPGGHVDLPLAILTVLTLGLRLVVVFAVPAYLLANLLAYLRARGRAALHAYRSPG